MTEDIIMVVFVVEKIRVFYVSIISLLNIYVHVHLAGNAIGLSGACCAIITPHCTCI